MVQKELKMRQLLGSLILGFSHGWIAESASESHSVMSDSLQPHGLSVEFSRPEYWRGYPFPFPEDLPNPEIEPRSPTFQADSLPAELQEKPKNTGVGSLSLLQQIFPTQESDRGLLLCRRILYQLSHQGSPDINLPSNKAYTMQLLFLICEKWLHCRSFLTLFKIIA